jgi:hypothetical protein
MSCTTAFTNTPITTTDTAGTRRVDLLGNHDLIPKTDTHLVVPAMSVRWLSKGCKKINSSLTHVGRLLRTD